MNTVQILKEARALIADEKNWIQGSLYYERNGENCYCAIGALDAVTGDDGEALGAATSVIHGMLGDGKSIVGFNDEHTHAEVLALFDEAIARAESEAVQ